MLFQLVPWPFLCPELTTVNLGTGLVSLGEAVFSGCHKLTTITIPSSVQVLGMGSLSNCNQLATTIWNGSKDN